MAAIELEEVRGWPQLRLTSDTLAVTVLPALGGTVTSLTRRADGAELLWSAPGGLRRPGLPPLPGTAYAQFVDTWPGGWHPVFPNGGQSVSIHGAEWGYDGEARLTALDWNFADSSLTMSGRLRRAPFELTRVLTLDGSELRLTETVRNVGGEPVETVWGNQLAIGGALLGPDTAIRAGASTVRPDPAGQSDADYDDVLPWPRSYGPAGLVNLSSVPAERSGQTRAAYLGDFSEATLSVNRPSAGLRLDLEWDGEAWPHLWYDLEAGGRADFPFFSCGYLLRLTPCSSWPGHGVYEARRVGGSTVTFEPDEERRAELALRVSTG